MTMYGSTMAASEESTGESAEDAGGASSAAAEEAAAERLAELVSDEVIDRMRSQFASKYPGLIATWERAWEQFIPFLEFHPSIRKVIYTTNAIVIDQLSTTENQ